MLEISPPHSSQLRSSAPANLMIMGEHSVVYGHPALACAINQRITIDWQQRNDNQIIIHSALAEHTTDLTHLHPHPKLAWVMAALKAFQPHLPHGLTLTIRSQFSSTIGFGSSAAVLAATLGGLNELCKTGFNLAQLFAMGHQIILNIQQRGSGTDLAASLTGGVIYFNPSDSNKITPVSQPALLQLPIHLIYCGYKTPTADVLAKVHQAWQNQPELLHNLYQLMAQTTQAAHQAWINQNPAEFFHLTNVYQGLMDALGVNDATLSQLIYQLRQQGADAAKISGSGLGDCVMAFNAQIKQLAWPRDAIYAVQIDPLGMTTSYPPLTQ